MPVVQANSQPYSGTPTVEPSVETPSRYQTETATPAAFGGAVAGAVTGLGRDVGEAANTLARTQDFINQVTADKLTNTYMDSENKLLYGDPDKPGDLGFYGKKGQEAVSAFPNVRDQLMGLRNQLSTSLPNSGARLLFDRDTRRLQSYTMGAMGRHFDNEYLEYSKEEAQGKIKNGMTSAAGAISQDDEDGWRNGIQSAVQGVQDLAKRSGLGPEAIKAQTDAIWGQAIKDKFEHLMQKDPLAADKFLDNNATLLPGDVYNQLKKNARSQTIMMQGRDEALRALGRPVPEHPLREGLEGPANLSGATANGVTSVAMLHTEAEQETVAKRIATTDGMQHWAGIDPNTGRPWNPDLRNALQQAGIPISGPLPEGMWPSAKQLIYRYESLGGRNVRNYAFDSTHTAGGYFQITNSTWNAFGGSDQPIHSEEEPTRGQFTTGPLRGLERGAASSDVAAFGDSIAAHIIRKAGASGQESGVVGLQKAGDTAVAGINPASVRNLVEHTPDSKINGKDIVLSTGAANVTRPLNDNDINDIKGEIDTFLAKGAKSVRVLGVGNSSVYSNHNDMLANVAGGYSAAGKPVMFTGPLRDVAGDGVHSKNPTGVLRTAMQTALPTPTIAEPTAPQAAGGTTTSAPASAPAANLGAPDVLLGEIKPLPKVDFPLPDHDSPNEIPDNQLPGMSQALTNIMKNIPPENVVLRQQAVKEARRMLNDEYTQAQRRHTLQREVRQDASEQRVKQYMQNIDTENPPSLQQIDNDTVLTAQHQSHLREILLNKKGAEIDPRTDHTNTMALFNRIIAPYGNVDKITTIDPITQAMGAGIISTRSGDWLLNHLDIQRKQGDESWMRQRDRFIHGSQHIIGGVMGDKDPDYGLRYNAFVNELEETRGKYNEDKKNPNDMFKQTDPKDIWSSPAAQILKKYESPTRLNFTATPGANNPIPDITATEPHEAAAQAKALVGKTFNINGQTRAFTYEDALNLMVQKGLAQRKPVEPQAPAR